MKSTESDVYYFEVDAVFNREPVELLEESTWTAGLRRTGNDTGEEVLGFLDFGDVFLSGPRQNNVSVVEARANESTRNHFGHVFRQRNGCGVGRGYDNGQTTDGIDMVIHG